MVEEVEEEKLKILVVKTFYSVNFKEEEMKIKLLILVTKLKIFVMLRIKSIVDQKANIMRSRRESSYQLGEGEEEEEKEKIIRVHAGKIDVKWYLLLSAGIYRP